MRIYGEKIKTIRFIFGGACVGVCLVYFAFLGRSDGMKSGTSDDAIDHRMKRDASRHLANLYDEPRQLSTEGKLKYAVEMVDNGDTDNAAEVLEQILYEEPENIRALLELSLIELLDRARPAAALPYLIKALKAEPSNDYLLSEVADIYMRRLSTTWAQIFSHSRCTYLLRQPLMFGLPSFYSIKARKCRPEILRSTTAGGPREPKLSLKARIHMKQGQTEVGLKEYQGRKSIFGQRSDSCCLPESRLTVL